jgi:hypothetical protein
LRRKNKTLSSEICSEKSRAERQEFWKAKLES